MDQSKLHDIVNLLVQLPASIDNRANCLRQLKENVEKAVEMLKECGRLDSKVHEVNRVTSKFTLTALHVLKLLAKSCTDDDNDVSSCLMSVQQQQRIKVLLQMIFSLGVSQSLLQGVNTALKNKTYQLHMLNLEELSLIESYLLMTDVVRSLIQILPTPSLRALILTHLGDLISALLQVSYAGALKKPTKARPPPPPPSSSSSSSTTEGEGKQTGKPGFVMTEDWYQKMMRDRNEFKVMYQKVVDDIYKPLVIKELLILLAPTKSIVNGEIVVPPPWFKRTISEKLTGYLVSPGGVSLIMRAMCESTSDAVDWNKAEVLGKLISTVHDKLPEEEFYAKISPQVISLLSTTGAYCIPVAKNCIRNIYHHNPDICNKYIFDKLFEMFIICSKPVSENFTGTLVSEDSSSRCIDHLTKCFAPGSKASSIPISSLTKIIKIMYKLYVKVAKSPCLHRVAIQDLLVEYFHAEKDMAKLTSVYNALIFEEPHEDILEMNEDLEFQFGPSGGIQVGRRRHDDPAPLPDAEFQLEFETAGDHMLDLLSHRSDLSKSLLSDLFIILMSALSDFHDHKIELSKSNPDILSVDELIVFLVKISQKKIITIKLLSVLAENVQVMETIQEKPEIVFKFVRNLLEFKAKDLLRSREGDDDDGDEDEDDLTGSEHEEDGAKEDAEDLLVALAVVDMITVNVKLHSDRWDMCKSLLGSLEIIKDNCQDPSIKYFSEVLYSRINTHGAVSGARKPQIRPFSGDKVFAASPKPGEPGRKTQTKKDSPKKNKKLICEVDEGGVSNNNNNNNNNNSNSSDDDVQKTELDTVLEEVCSDDVPTRGHAIIQLGKLIRRKSPLVLSKRDYVFSVLKCNLKHEDTYIYLSAINSLEILGSVEKPDRIFEVLCEEYTDHKREFSEIQMKIGEVLMRLTRGLGFLAPKYKSLLINTFLYGTKSPDEILRVSSLSNLGELLSILGYGVGNIIQEVFMCVKSIAATDKSDMARRAAVMVIQFLLKGVTADSFMVLEFVIRDLYRSLLHIYKTDKDDVTRLHAELALAEINRIVTPSIGRPKKLEKHIGILGLPQ